jgi:hypothetical protein
MCRALLDDPHANNIPSAFLATPPENEQEFLHIISQTV